MSLSRPHPDDLVFSHQGLVRAIARGIHRSFPSYIDLDDLIGYGQLGLTQAARDFDPERGIQFSTFAYYRIRGAILDGANQMNWLKRTTRKPEEKALNFSYTFLGVRLECAQCHKHPFDQWTQDDFNQFTAFFNGIKPKARRTFDGFGVKLMMEPPAGGMMIPDSKTEVHARFLDGRAPDPAQPPLKDAREPVAT